MPVSFMGDINVEANLTTDEKRELLGYGAIEVQSDLVTENPIPDVATNPTA